MSLGNDGISCSRDTCWVPMQAKWPGMKAPVRTLEVGETTVLQLQPSDGGEPVAVGVTPLDACHCLVRRAMLTLPRRMSNDKDAPSDAKIDCLPSWSRKTRSESRIHLNSGKFFDYE